MLKIHQQKSFSFIHADIFPWKGYWSLLFIFSFLLFGIWGIFPDTETFLSLQFTQAFIAGTGYKQAFINNNAWHISPLYTLILAAFQLFNLPLPSVAASLTAIGWGVATVICSRLLREIGYFAIAVLTPILLLLSPWFFLSVANHVSWVIVVGWLAFIAAHRQQEKQLLLYLLLLVSISISWPALSLGIILFTWSCVQKRVMLWKLGLYLLIPFGLTAFVIVWQTLRPFSNIASPSDWWHWWQNFVNTSELFWLILPLTIIGLWCQPRIRPLGLWAGLSLLTFTFSAQVIVGINLLLLASIGIAEMSRWIVRMQKIDLEDQQARFLVGALLLIPLIWGIIEWDTNAYLQRPITISQLEKEAGHLIKAQGSSESMVMGSARTGYYAQHPTFVWNGRPDNQEDLAQLLLEISKNPPQYIITSRTAVWQEITNLGWFKDRYRQSHQLNHPNEPTAPFIIWQYHPDPVIDAPIHPLNIILENGAKLVGYQQWPQAIQPGEAIHIALHWQQPIKRAFVTVAWLPGPLGDTNEALRDMITPRAIPPNWLQEGQTITDQIVLTTTEKIAPGGYEINVSFREQNSFDKMPFYQNEDVNPLDRIQLSYVAVPWQGDVPTDAIPTNITFGESIQLAAAKLPTATARPNEQLPFTLYWQTIQQPQANYTIFLQLLNEHGELVASGDSLPMGGQYATRAWLPDHTIPDTHFLTIPEGIPSGSYTVKTGLYLAETGERLPAFAATGQQLIDNAYTIMTIEIE